MSSIEFDLNLNNYSEINLDDLSTLSNTYSKILPLDGSFLVEINLINEDESLRLNHDYRGKESATDVLTFPSISFDQIGIPQFKANMRVLLGSINICPEIASEREEAIIDLVSHGLLHLAGYDHEMDEQAWKTQEKVIILELEGKGLKIKSLYDYC